MLTKTQKQYLTNLPKDKLSEKVVVEPWNPKSLEILDSIVSEIENVTGEKVLYMGSSALQIAGEKDIDLFILKKEINIDLISKITNLLKCDPIELKWKFVREGFKVTLKIADPEDQKRKEQICFFEVLKSHPLLKKKYESVKVTHSNSFQDYIIAKMDFVTRVVYYFNEKNQERIRYLIENKCALDNNHIFITRNLHTSQSFDIRIFVKNEVLIDEIIENLLEDINEDFEIVVGIPRNGDIIGKRVAVKTNKTFISGEDILQNCLTNKRILIVDDTVVSGETISSLAKDIKNVGGIVVGAFAICCRRNIPDNLFQNDALKFATYIIQDDTLFGYSEEDCPYCEANIHFSDKFGFYKKM